VASKHPTSSQHYAKSVASYALQISFFHTLQAEANAFLYVSQLLPAAAADGLRSTSSITTLLSIIKISGVAASKTCSISF